MKTVVLLSGGLDSAVVLALNHVDTVETITVDYGQRHQREIGAAEAIADHYGVPWTLTSVDPRFFTGSALTGGGDIPLGHAEQPDATYVPARNTVLLALAAARAETIGAGRVAIGANADDAAGYPDCRPNYLEAYRDVLQLGTRSHIWITAPLLNYGKQRIQREAKRLGVPIHLTWSCYLGGAEPCGECGACVAVTA